MSTDTKNEKEIKVTTYTLDQLINYDLEGINSIQKNIEDDAKIYLSNNLPNMPFLSSEEKEMLFESFNNSMEKYRLLVNAIVSGFSTSENLGYPENIYNLDINTGVIERDANNRRIDYNIDILAPCTTSALRYINSEGNNVFTVIPPIKSYSRTVQKIITECVHEYNENIQKDLKKLKLEKPIKEYKSTKIKLLELQKIYNANKSFFNKYSKLPKDIYRLTITSKYKDDLSKLINRLSKNFPEYIKFENNQRNAYNSSLKDNTRFYFDIKNTAKITIPETNKYFYIEFQFKQTNMFFAHIRSHKAYESYRTLKSKHSQFKDSLGANPSAEDELKLQNQEMLCKKKQQLCVEIHKNAVHQSNLYLMHKIAWLDNNSRGLGRKPENPDGTYNHSINVIRNNYIVEDFIPFKDNSETNNEINIIPFDGVTAFSTSDNEYLNKAHYLKMIDILPEHFDELNENIIKDGINKTAKEIVNEKWQTLTNADKKDFNSISNIAIKYQNVIRQIQSEKHLKDKEAQEKAIKENKPAKKSDLDSSYILNKIAKLYD